MRAFGIYGSPLGLFLAAAGGDDVAQPACRTEGEALVRRDEDLLSGGGVDADAAGPAGDLEGAEVLDAHRAPFAQAALDRLEDGLDDLGGLELGEAAMPIVDD